MSLLKALRRVGCLTSQPDQQGGQREGSPSEGLNGEQVRPQKVVAAVLPSSADLPPGAACFIQSLLTHLPAPLPQQDLARRSVEEKARLAHASDHQLMLAMLRRHSQPLAPPGAARAG